MTFANINPGFHGVDYTFCDTVISLNLLLNTNLWMTPTDARQTFYRLHWLSFKPHPHPCRLFSSWTDQGSDICYNRSAFWMSICAEIAGAALSCHFNKIVRTMAFQCNFRCHCHRTQAMLTGIVTLGRSKGWVMLQKNWSEWCVVGHQSWCDASRFVLFSVTSLLVSANRTYWSFRKWFPSCN